MQARIVTPMIAVRAVKPDMLSSPHIPPMVASTRHAVFAVPSTAPLENALGAVVKKEALAALIMDSATMANLNYYTMVMAAVSVAQTYLRHCFC